MNHALNQWQTVQQALEALRAEPAQTTAFVRLAREQQALLQALPPRFGEVLLPLLDRLESSALFSEESCSFSQRDLLDSLQLWLDKARERLN
jgi:2-keto-3-deoxy-L-rhamnonate aldolase RhmA